MTTPAALKSIVVQGESDTLKLKLKRSTAKLKRARETRHRWALSVGAGDVVSGGHQVGTKAPSSLHQVKCSTLRKPRAGGPDGPWDRTDRTKFRDQVVALPLEAGLVEMTIADKAGSSKQRYHTMDAGRATRATTRKA